MSATAGAIRRRHSIVPAPHRAPLAALPVALAILAAGLASADAPSVAIRLSGADAARAGVAIGLVPHRVGAANLIEIVPPSGSRAADQPEPALLAVSADGRGAALADRLGDVTGSLTVAEEDGSQLRMPLPGLLGAAFALDAEWLAVIDGRGGLWRVDVESGSALPLSDGPFVGSPVALADGSLLLISVPSVAAPYRSQLLRLDPATGVTTVLSSDELVYAGFPLDGGGLAVVAHLPEGTVVRVIAAGAAQLVRNLGPGAVNVAVDPSGKRLAFEAAGEIFVADDASAAPRRVGAGTRPCFAADGSTLLARREGTRILMAADGAPLFSTVRPAGLAGAVGCLP